MLVLCNCVYCYQQAYSQLAEPLWTDPGLKCGVGARELTSTSKNKQTNKQTNKQEKEAQAGNESSNFPPMSSQARKKPFQPNPNSAQHVLKLKPNFIQYKPYRPNLVRLNETKSIPTTSEEVPNQKLNKCKIRLVKKRRLDFRTDNREHKRLR